MDPNNLIFSSKIDVDIEENCFKILLDYLSDLQFDEVYVKNVVYAPNELLFFAEIDESETIIRVPIKLD